MKAPMCKLCGKAHWTYESHGEGPEVPGYIKDMVGAIGGSPTAEEGKGDGLGAVARVASHVTPRAATPSSAVEPPPVTQKTCNACNKPYNNRGNVCNACRQRAYRERSK